MTEAKKKYIEATFELIERDGLAGVSTRKIAEEIGCTSPALYRHFPDIDKLIAVASIRFLRDYIEDARQLSQVDLNPLELNLQLWECLAFYSFQRAALFEKLFFSDPSGQLYSEAVSEYFTQYPEDLMGLKAFIFDLFMNSTIAERDLILLEQAEEKGMIAPESSIYLSKMDSYLYRGMLASLKGSNLGEEDIREATREFMQLIIKGYTQQLKEGYSILVVSPDFKVPDPMKELDVRSSYRVKTVPVTIERVAARESRATA